MKLVVKDIYYKYAGCEDYIFENVNLNIESGRIVAIQGENGCGKTTLIKLLSGILHISEGVVSLNGNSVGSTFYKDMCAYIPDKPIVFNELTGIEHMGLIIDLWKIKGDKKKAYIDKVISLSKDFMLDRFMYNKVGTYSLGTKYKLFFILMIARNPKLILMDEPLTSLDFNSQSKAIKLLKNISDDSIIIMTSHQIELIKLLADKKYNIVNNNVIQSLEE